VALKVPAQDLRADAQAIDRFVLEEWVARRIDHPHVLKPAAVRRRPRQHLFVAMEHIDGQTLAQWMRDHPGPAWPRCGPGCSNRSGLQACTARRCCTRTCGPRT
jgi:serine/threonine protein kinase